MTNHSKSIEITKSEFLTAIAGLCPDQQSLLVKANSEATSQTERLFVIEMALCNAWKGPCLTSDWVRSLRDYKYLSKLRAIDRSGCNQYTFDVDLSKFSVIEVAATLPGVGEVGIAVLIADRDIDWMLLLDRTSNPDTSDAKYIYCIRPAELPGVLADDD